MYRIGFPLSVCDKQGRSAIGANVEGLRLGGLTGGKDGAAAVEGNYGFLIFLAGLGGV